MSVMTVVINASSSLTSHLSLESVLISLVSPVQDDRCQGTCRGCLSPVQCHARAAGVEQARCAATECADCAWHCSICIWASASHALSGCPARSPCCCPSKRRPFLAAFYQARFLNVLTWLLVCRAFLASVFICLTAPDLYGPSSILLPRSA